MVTKNQIKLISSLNHKKYRTQLQLFVAEGQKLIAELLDANFDLEQLYQTEAVFDTIQTSKKHTITNDELKKISFLNTPNNCLALFKIPKVKTERIGGLKIVLDVISDPGNLGTIIRLCDWFGISDLICSSDSVDVYNPKVVQATMGSLARVNVVYTNLENYLSKTNEPVYGAFMDGKPVYEEKFPENALLILGNEANGISSNIAHFVTKKITIPRFGMLQKTESLNVATATAILINEFKRDLMKRKIN